MLERFVIPFLKRNSESLGCAKVVRMMYSEMIPMDELCWNCYWFNHGWCENFQEFVEEDGYCEEWEETNEEPDFFDGRVEYPFVSDI